LDRAVPADLTYTIGQSKPSEDWYYAQAKPGDWRIAFNLDHEVHGEGVLTLGIAGQTSNPELRVYLNGSHIGDYAGENSSALYRSAVLGSSFSECKTFRFPASKFRQGANVVTLRLFGRGSVMYDTVKLEVDDPKLPKQIPIVVSKP
jgi:rhamnogalacturonan endolyase